MKTFSTFVASLLALSLFSCTHSPTRTSKLLSSEKVSPRLPALAELKSPGVSRELAAYRAYFVRSPRYELWLGLNDVDTHFKGRLSLQFVIPAERFDLLDEQGVPLDFENGKLEKLTLNSRPLRTSGEGSAVNPSRIRLPRAQLQPGLNTVDVHFQSSGTQSERGLRRVVDPADQSVYWFSQIQTEGLQQITPCFDQPDLKGTFDLTVDAPEDWVVVSHSMESEVSKAGVLERWEFPESPPLSPLKFALAAGPFQEWSSEVDGVPLRMLTRSSLKNKVTPGPWLELTERGLTQLISTIGNPFPFVKFDQVFLPIAKSSTLQGVSFFPEKFLETQPETPGFLSIADTVFSQFASAWFGNSITPRWHNSTWIDTSLSRHTGLLALSQVTPYGKSTWNLLSAERAQSVLLKNSSTRVNTSVPHSRIPHSSGIAERTFGPLYFCSLRSQVGAEKWGHFLQNFTTRYAKKTATLGDLLYSLEKASILTDPGYLTSGQLRESIQCDQGS